MFQTSESCIKLHVVAVLELLLSEPCPLLQVCVCVPTAPGVCVYLDGSHTENTFHCWLYSVELCVTNKQKKYIYIYLKKEIYTDYGKMLKYREKYR